MSPRKAFISHFSSITSYSFFRGVTKNDERKAGKFYCWLDSLSFNYSLFLCTSHSFDFLTKYEIHRVSTILPPLLFNSLPLHASMSVEWEKEAKNSSKRGDRCSTEHQENSSTLYEKIGQRRKKSEETHAKEITVGGREECKTFVCNVLWVEWNAFSRALELKVLQNRWKTTHAKVRGGVITLDEMWVFCFRTRKRERGLPMSSSLIRLGRSSSCHNMEETFIQMVSR